MTSSTTARAPAEQPAPEAMPADWPDELTRSSLQLLAEGICELAGFGVASIAVVREDGLIHTFAVAGNDDARATLMGRAASPEIFTRALAAGEDWGRFRFVAAERFAAAGLARPTWVADYEPLDDPGAWQPYDLLIAPLTDEHGRLSGTISIDLPLDGRRPGPTKRAELNEYAEMATRTLATALERTRLARHLRLAEASRRIVHDASQELTLENVVSRTGSSVLETFGLSSLWTLLFSDDWTTPTAAYGTEVPWRRDLGHVAQQSAERLWAWGTVGVYGRDQWINVGRPTEQDRAVLDDYLTQNGLSSILNVPLGAGDRALGSLAMLRSVDQPLWTATELRVVRDLGRDLGQLLSTAQELQRQRELAGRLRALDRDRSRLVAVVAHELRNPLTIIGTHLELLEEADGLTPVPGRREVATDAGDHPEVAVRRALDALDRGATRMLAIAEDLRLLSSTSAPDWSPDASGVDLVALAYDVVEHSRTAAVAHGVEVVVEEPAEPVLAVGDASALDRVLVNLVDNAVKYTPAGGRVTLAFRRSASTVEMTVTDTGIGIPAEDVPHLFAAFYRSQAAQDQPGSGLGLAIVDRITRSLSGTVAVESVPGAGSTFRVRLPAAAQEQHR